MAANSPNPSTQVSGNARKLWNSLSSVMGRNRCSSTTSSGLTADSFAKFFCDKVGDVRSSTAGGADPEYATFHGHPLDEFAQLSISDVERLIKDSPTKACGLDPIPTWLVKEFVQHLAPFLTFLFNRSLLQSQFPENFRIAEVTPILKKPTLDPSVLGSYRPISNLPFISKVLERAVNERMLLHLHANGLLPEHQSAYRRSHSTETALLKVPQTPWLQPTRVNLLSLVCSIWVLPSIAWTTESFSVDWRCRLGLEERCSTGCAHT